MNYMVNKDHKVRHKGKSYIYGDDLPEDIVINDTWIAQRVVILKKVVKEEKIKTSKRVLKINKEIKGDLL